MSEQITVENKQLNMQLSLSQVAAVLGVDLIGRDCEFSRVSINTRTLKKGDLFIAIKGDNFDAHNYLQQAEEQGACGLLINQNYTPDGNVDTELNIPCIKVADTRRAFGDIAALWSSAFSLPIIAITGSCGKTTVKEMSAAILHSAFSNDENKEAILATRGNLNNDIGVPLTLLRLNKAHRAAVIEMGANHMGEIRQLVDIVQPDVAVITNVVPAHIEGFGSIEAIAQAKSEIYRGIELEGTAVINADDEFSDYWRNICEQQKKPLTIVSFGLDKTADIYADFKKTEYGTDIKIITPKGNVSIKLHQFGRHNVYNALAAAAVTLAAGVSLQDIKSGLENFTNVAGRLEQKRGFQGSTVFDDTYNANPGSVRAGVEAIQQLKGEHVVVLGDMGELGAAAQQLHYELGRVIRKMGIKHLYTLGSLSEACTKGFRDTAGNDATAEHFTDKAALIEALKMNLRMEHVILIKGSRSAAMEDIVSALVVDAEQEGCFSDNRASDNNSKKGT